MPEYDINDYKKFKSGYLKEPALKEPTFEDNIRAVGLIAFGDALRKYEDLGKKLLNVFEEPANIMNKGVSQLQDNPIAGGINIGNSILSFAATPFGMADVLTRELPGGNTVADIVAKPFELTAEGVKWYRENLGVKELEKKVVENIKTSPTGEPILNKKQVEEVLEAKGQLDEITAQFLVGGIGFKGLKTLKGKLSPKKIPKEVATEVKPIEESISKTKNQELIDRIKKDAEKELKSKELLKQKLKEGYERVIPISEKLSQKEGFERVESLVKKLQNEEILSKPENLELAGITKSKNNRFMKNGKYISKQNAIEEVQNATRLRENERRVQEENVRQGSEGKGSQNLERKISEQPRYTKEAQIKYYEDVNNIPILADKIIKGEKLKPEDLQLQSNFPKELEAELRSKYETPKVTETPVKETPPIKEQLPETPVKQTVEGTGGVEVPIEKYKKEGKTGFKPETYREELEKRSQEESEKSRIATEKLNKEMSESEAELPIEERIDLKVRRGEKLTSTENKYFQKEQFAPEGFRYDAKGNLVKIPANVIFTEERYQKAKKNLQEKGQRLSAGLDPSIIKDLTEVGGYHFEKGLRNFAEWSKKMVEEYGEGVKRYLDRVWLDLQIKEKPKILESETSIKQITNAGITEAEILRNRELMSKRESFTEKTKESVKQESKSLRYWARDKLKPKDTQLFEIDPEIYRAVKQADFTKELKLRTEEKIGTAFLDKIKKLSKNEFYDLDLLFKNELEQPIRKILKNKAEREFDAVKNLLEKYREELGIEKTKEFYFPREVRDYEGFMKVFYGKLEAKTGKEFTGKAKDIFDRLIEDKKAKTGKKELTIEEQATLINNAIRGYNPGVRLSKFKNEFERVVKVLDAEMSQFYHNFDASLMSYIEQARTKIEARNFFGKKSGDAPAVTEHSIGRMIAEGRIRSDKPLTPEKIRQLTDVLKSGFEPKGSHGWINTIKEIGYITRLFNFINSMTQLGDYYVSLYRSPVRSVEAVSRAFASKVKLAGKSKVKLEELGYDVSQMAREFSDPRRRGWISRTTSEWSLFKGIDIGMKETFVNILNNKYTKLAKDGKLVKGHPDYWRFEKRFGKDADAVISEFKNPEMTPRKAFQLWDELDAAQPISIWSTPPGFHTSGQMQIAWQMKTFALRRLDFILNESKRRFMDKTLSRKERIRAGKNLAKLITAIVLTEGAVDTAKKILKGEEADIPDIVVDNLLGLVLMSKYDISKIKRDGFASALFDKISPVLGLIDDFGGDLIGLFEGKPRFKTIRNIPIAGEVIYNWIKENAKKSYSRNYSR